RRARIRICRARAPTDSILTVVIPDDSIALMADSTLGRPILDMGDLMNEREFRGLGRAVGALPQSPWGAKLTLPHGVSSVVSHSRYNRVEGLSLGIGAKADFGKLDLTGMARLGVADLDPNLELRLGRRTANTRWSLGGYRRLAAANPEVKPF